MSKNTPTQLGFNLSLGTEDSKSETRSSRDQETKKGIKKILSLSLHSGDSIQLIPGKFGGFYKVFEFSNEKYIPTRTTFEVTSFTGPLIYEGKQGLNSIFYVESSGIYISMLYRTCYMDYEKV